VAASLPSLVRPPEWSSAEEAAPFVQISAPPAVLEERLASESRRAHHKLLDAHRLRQLLAELDPSPLHPEDLLVDTGSMSPDEAARIIAAATSCSG
jgi:hypothetical protein